MSSHECFQRAVHCQQVADMEASEAVRLSLLAAAEDWCRLGLQAQEDEKRAASERVSYAG